MSELAIGLLQFTPTACKGENLATVRRLAKLAAGRGADVVIAPEYSLFFDGPLSEAYAQAAEDVPGEFTSGLAETAREQKIFLVAGILEKTDGERPANTVIAIDPSGEIVARYRKLHLYDAFGQKESEWITPGDNLEAVTFEAHGFTIGLQTCYDLRFPEVSRMLVDAGAEVLAVPAEWAKGSLKEHAWRTLLAARAIENCCFVAAADQAVGAAVGLSAIVDPSGITRAGLDAGEGVAVGVIRSEEVQQVRETNPALRSRRFHVEPGAPVNRA